MSIDTQIQEVSPEEDQRYLSSVARAFSILEALSENHKSQSLTELSRATSVAVPTLQRMTKTLEAFGYITKNERTKRYCTAIRTVDLLHNYLASNELAKTVWPHLVRLRESTGLGVSFSVPAGGSMMYVHRFPSYRGDFENTLPGKKIPLHLSASGRCVLASWTDDQIEEYLNNTVFSKQTAYSLTSRVSLGKQLTFVTANGYCIVEQEVSMGASTIAAPILEGNSVRAGISIHVSSSIWPQNRLVDNLSSRLLDVTRALGGS